jgi:4-hydroxy-tetrahydrodipicolinate synthase
MTRSNHPFAGTGVALVTPFSKDGTVDLDGLGNIMDYNIRNGVDYFVVLGTTGESVTLNVDEKHAVYAFAAEHANGRVKLVAGIGGNDTNEVAQALESFDHAGYSAVLSVSPYYNKPTQQGIYLHYKVLIEASPLPIILYNVPGRTASNIGVDTALKLANESNRIIGIKEASGNFSQIMKLVQHQPKHFRVISGDDNITLPMMSVGAIGVISVVAQAFPKVFSQMVNAALDGDFTKAQKQHYSLLDAMESFFAEGNPGGVKAALHAQGLCENVLRLPLVPATNELYAKIKSQVNGLVKTKAKA